MTVSIIILSYNTKKLLIECLTALPLKRKDIEVIVVDNGSTDGSAEAVARRFPGVYLIRNLVNTGFSAGNNQGMKVAKGKYFFLLNSDAVASEAAIDKLVLYLDRHPEMGAVTPKVILPDGGIDLACHRGIPTPWRALTYFLKLEQLAPNFKPFAGYHQTYLNFDKAHEIEATAATALMVRAKVIKEVGGFDERFFFYAEDLDWCKRVGDEGWKIAYLPEAEVLHFKSRSGKRKQSKRAQEEAKRHFWETMRQFYDKHYDKKYPWWVKKLVYGGIAIKKRLT